MIGCEECMKCGECPLAFPEKYIDGGAEKCKSFEQETDDQIIIGNIKIKIEQIKANYTAKGIYL
jgi:hypothetical protein